MPPSDPLTLSGCERRRSPPSSPCRTCERSFLGGYYNRGQITFQDVWHGVHNMRHMWQFCEIHTPDVRRSQPCRAFLTFLPRAPARRQSRREGRKAAPNAIKPPRRAPLRAAGQSKKPPRHLQGRCRGGGRKKKKPLPSAGGAGGAARAARHGRSGTGGAVRAERHGRESG